MTVETEEVSDKQGAYLKALLKLRALGFSPTYREIGLAMKPARTSSNGINQMLTRLKRKGLVTWEKGKPRTVRLTADGEREAATWTE